MSQPTIPPPGPEETWIGVSVEPLAVDVAAGWAVRPDCGALALFSGTARDHAAGRPGVYKLEYEAYEEYVIPVLRSIAGEARRRWPDLGRIVLWHRVGEVAIGDSAVVVAASAPHRESAFAAARFCIDTTKRTAPIWKREFWDGGESWGRCDHEEPGSEPADHVLAGTAAAGGAVGDGDGDPSDPLVPSVAGEGVPPPRSGKR